MSELEGSVAVKQELEGEMLPKGNDGISPTISLEKIEGGHRVTIADIHGEKSFDIIDGSSDLFIVHLKSDDSLSYDAEQIIEAKNNEKAVVLLRNGILYHFEKITGRSMYFVRYLTEEGCLYAERIQITDSSSISESREAINAMQDQNLVVVQSIDGVLNYSSSQIYEMTQNGKAVVYVCDGHIYHPELLYEGVAVFRRYYFDGTRICCEEASIIGGAGGAPAAKEVGYMTKEDVVDEIASAQSWFVPKEKEWELIEEVTLEKAVSMYVAPITAGKYKEVYIEANTTIETAETTAKNMRFGIGRAGNSMNCFDRSVSNGTRIYIRAHGYHSPTLDEVYDLSVSSYTFAMGDLQRNAGSAIIQNGIRSEEFFEVRVIINSPGSVVTDHAFAVGSTFKIWGR